jgi:DNA primase
MTLLALLTQEIPLRKVAGTHGGEYAGACPWCGGRDRFRVWPQGEKPGYWCRQCDRKGDAIQYLRDRYGLSYREACARLGALPASGNRPGPTHPPQAPPLALAPSFVWQTQARTFTDTCEQTLWSTIGGDVRAYLHRRGLHDETIREAKLGYHHTTRHEPRALWGLRREGGEKPVWLPSGLVFPWWVEGVLWRVVIRQLKGKGEKTAKYITVSGGRNTLYRVDTLQPGQPAMIVEGCLDALAMVQESGDLVAIVAAGSTTGGRLERWIARLTLASHVLVAFDADEGGDTAAAWWLRALEGKGKRWRPYWDDPNAMLQAGADLRTWVREGLVLQPRWWRELAGWPKSHREWWAERAGLMEVDGGLSRAAAEWEAFCLLRDMTGNGGVDPLVTSPEQPMEDITR